MGIKHSLINAAAFVFSLFPRNPHLWLTGKPSPWYADFTPPKFFDNSKYFFLYLVQNTKEKVYWVSSSKEEIALLKSMHLPVVRYKSIRGIWLTLRAKYFFHHYGTDQINPNLQHGAVQLDFWHGTPLKKIRYDVVPKVETQKSKLEQFLDRKGIEYVSSTSPYLTKNILAHAFAVPENQFLNYGYPRTDVLKLSREETAAFCKTYSPELLTYIETAGRFKKVLLYMPTWRDDDPDYFSKTNINLARLNEELAKHDYVLFLKLHPLTKNVSVEAFSNIYQLDNDVDIYPFLNHTDFLITDYSSIYFDYLLTDKEIIFIPYDYDNYIANRALYFDYNEITPGKKYATFDEFMNDLAALESLDYSDERKKVRDLLVADYHFDASEKIYSFIKEGRCTK